MLPLGACRLVVYFVIVCMCVRVLQLVHAVARAPRFRQPLPPLPPPHAGTHSTSTRSFRLRGCVLENCVELGVFYIYVMDVWLNRRGVGWLCVEWSLGYMSGWR